MKTTREKIVEIINNNIIGTVRGDAVDQIEKLIEEEKKELAEWAKKNYVDIKHGEQSAGGNPKVWTKYIQLQELLNKLNK